MSKTKMLFRGPVGIPVLKRVGLNPGLCWHSCCLHLHLGSLPLGWQGNFQKVANGFVDGGVGFVAGVFVWLLLLPVKVG